MTPPERYLLLLVLVCIFYGTKTPDTSGLDADKEERRSSDSLTSPICLGNIPIPEVGVTASQTNCNMDSSSREGAGQPANCTLCGQDKLVWLHCGQCQNKFCLRCESFHDGFCGEDHVMVLQDPSDSSSSVQTPSHCNIRQELLEVQDFLKKLNEEERKLNQERKAINDSISVRYSYLVDLVADAHDTCCLSLNEVYDGLMERLHSSRDEAWHAMDTLHHQISSSQPVPVSASQLRAALFMQEKLPMILDRDLGSCSLLHHHMEDNTSLMLETLQSFMGKIVRPGRSSGPSQSQAPSRSPSVHDVHQAMPPTGADPNILNDLSKKVEDLAGQVTSLQTTNTQLSKHVTLLIDAYSKLSTEQSILLRAMKALKEKNVQLTTEQAALQREVTAMRDNTIDHRDLALLMAEKGKVSAELEKLRKDVVSVQTDTSKQTKDIVQLKHHWDWVVEKLSGVMSDTVSSQEDGTYMEEDIMAVQKDSTSRKKLIMALQGDGTSTKDFDQLKKDCSGLKLDIADIQRNLNDLESPFGHTAVPPTASNRPPRPFPGRVIGCAPATIQAGPVVSQGIVPQALPRRMVIPGQEPLSTSMLVGAPPLQQKQILGEHLYPLIQRMCPNQARRITGMLLELDCSEVLLMLECQQSLKAMVESAMAQLQDHNHSF